MCCGAHDAGWSCAGFVFGCVELMGREGEEDTSGERGVGTKTGAYCGDHHSDLRGLLPNLRSTASVVIALPPTAFDSASFGDSKLPEKLSALSTAIKRCAFSQSYSASLLRSRSTKRNSAPLSAADESASQVCGSACLFTAVGTSSSSSSLFGDTSAITSESVSVP